MENNVLVFCSFLLALLACSSSIRQQSVAVSGRLMCGNKPAAGIKVKLWDEDGGPDPDDVLNETYTDEGGAFYVTGTERELMNINPVVKIYHDCDDDVLPGQRKVKFFIPDTYIYSGSKAKHAFNLGYLNLETIFPGEERKFL